MTFFCERGKLFSAKAGGKISVAAPLKKKREGKVKVHSLPIWAAQCSFLNLTYWQIFWCWYVAKGKTKPMVLFPALSGYYYPQGRFYKIDHSSNKYLLTFRFRALSLSCDQFNTDLVDFVAKTIILKLPIYACHNSFHIYFVANFRWHNYKQHTKGLI